MAGLCFMGVYMTDPKPIVEAHKSIAINKAVVLLVLAIIIIRLSEFIHLLT
jgi:hypothetical protein